MLCDLLGFEGLEIISDLLQNRTPIAVHVSQQRTERENAEANSRNMAAPAAFAGFSITTTINQQAMKQMKKDERRRRKEEADEEKDGWLKKQGFDPAALRAKFEAQLAAGPTTSSRGPATFDGSVAGFAGAAKLSLPPGTKRILHEKDGYEEILVPPQTKAPVRGSERRVPTSEFSAFCQPAFEGIPGTHFFYIKKVLTTVVFCSKCTRPLTVENSPPYTHSLSLFLSFSLSLPPSHTLTHSLSFSHV